MSKQIPKRSDYAKASRKRADAEELWAKVFKKPAVVPADGDPRAHGSTATANRQLPTTSERK